MSPKKVEIIVVYGFHPFEEFAVEVGKRLRKLNLKNLEVIRFTAQSIGEDFLEQDLTERIKRNWRGASELRSYIRKFYEKPDFVIVLHCYPFILEKDYPHPYYDIHYPAWNFKLEKAINQFINTYEKVDPKRIMCLGASPRGFVGYSASSIEYFPEIRIKGELDSLSLENATEFTLDYIAWIRKHYLKS